MNGDQMILQSKDGEKKKVGICGTITSKWPMVLLVQKNILQCHSLSETQNKTQKINKLCNKLHSLSGITWNSCSSRHSIIRGKVRP